MPIIQKLASFIANILKFHKLKILVTLVSSLIIAVIIFPYDDLSDVLTTQITKATGNQVYVQFEHLGINLFPTPGLSLDKVEIDTPITSSLKAGELSLSPSLPSLLLMKLEITARLQDFLNGKLSFSFQSKKSLKETNGSGSYDISGSSLDLARLSSLASLPVSLKGQMSLDIEGNVDPTLEEPMNAEFEFDGQKVQLLPLRMDIPNFGPMDLPGLKLAQLLAKGRFLPKEGSSSRGMQNQDLVLEDVQLGNEKDALSGKLKGRITVRMQSTGNQLNASISDYELRVQLHARPEAQKDFGVFLGFLDSHKKSSPSGSLYTFKVASTNPYQPPQITTLQVFQ
ncbi:MAG: type II secretion system protein GspN [Bdellovibrionales bacterium]|nr:type II secretion system protein GspN [Bdellovibrionales bacterium]